MILEHDYDQPQAAESTKSTGDLSAQCIIEGDMAPILSS